MSDSIQLQITDRDQTGTAASRNLRRDKRVPAIIYGGKVDPQPISLSLFDLQRTMQEDAFYTSILELKSPSGVQRTVLKALERHPIRNEPIHLDFLRVTDSTQVNMSIPLSFLNEDQCIGVREAGGVITYQLTQVAIAARADRIPERLEVDMADVEIGQPVLLSSISLPEGVSIPMLDQGQNPTVVVVLSPKISKEDQALDAAEEAASAEEEAEAGAEKGADGATDESGEGDSAG